MECFFFVLQQVAFQHTTSRWWDQFLKSLSSPGLQSFYSFCEKKLSLEKVLLSSDAKLYSWGTYPTREQGISTQSYLPTSEIQEPINIF